MTRKCDLVAGGLVAGGICIALFVDAAVVVGGQIYYLAMKFTEMPWLTWKEVIFPRGIVPEVLIYSWATVLAFLPTILLLTIITGVREVIKDIRKED